MLAEQQLILEQSVILDSVAGTRSFRKTWKQLADQYQAEWLVIECICSDETFHRGLLVARQRKIPGWHELQWSDVERVKSYYLPWEGELLVLDMMETFEENLAKALSYCG